MPPATFWRPALGRPRRYVTNPRDHVATPSQPNHATWLQQSCNQVARGGGSAADDECALADQRAVVVLRAGSQTRPDEPGVAAGAEPLDVDARPGRPFRQHLLT